MAKMSEGDFIDIGPQCFASADERVINWKGENYYQACGNVVLRSSDGHATTCVKRVNHASKDCEDYDGNPSSTPGHFPFKRT